MWAVGALVRAIADALAARFNPVTVRGELSGFSRAASGHCYFTLKDAQGQIRCAMFKRAASSLDFAPRDGELVELQGRLGVYEQRGDLQLIVEQLQRAGQGALFEQFLRLKVQLEAEGLFDPARRRELPALPRCVGIVTSLAQLVVDVFDVPLARVRVLTGDTDRINGAGSAGSRSIFTGGSAVSAASSFATAACSVSRSAGSQAMR